MTLTNEAINAAQGLASFDWPVFPANPDARNSDLPVDKLCALIVRDNLIK